MELAKFGYRSEKEVNQFKIPAICFGDMLEPII
jgi:hypothetical protein